MKQRRGNVWGYSTDQEHWLGRFETRSQAIAAGRADYGEGQTFYIVVGRWEDPGWYFDAAAVISDANDQVYQYEPKEKQLQFAKGAAAKLDKLLARWCLDYVSFDRWDPYGTPELVQVPVRKRKRGTK